MSINLYLVRHGRLNTNENDKSQYLHLSAAGIAFSDYLNKHFAGTYFDHIFYQSIDSKNSDPYNKCRLTVQGMKGVKSEVNITRLTRTFEALNSEDSGILNVMLCFRAEGFNVISNIISSDNDEEFNSDYNRIFHYRFSGNHYRFIDKVTAME